MTHEYLEAFDSYFPGAEIEYYHYDQLGSHYSDQPDEPDLWEIDRFVEEVEQCEWRAGSMPRTLPLWPVVGRHPGDGVCAQVPEAPERLDHLQYDGLYSGIQCLCGCQAETSDGPCVLAEVERIEAAEDYENPRYMELLIPHHYEEHILRMPYATWPDPVNRAFKHVNPSIYVPMQGPSELGASGKLLAWDRTADLPNLFVPTLTIGAAYDTMDPTHMEWMAGQVQRGRYLHCPKGSHLTLYDDPEPYFEGIIRFINDVDAARF